MNRDFVIGDVHGCAKTLKELVEAKLKPDKDDRIYFLGDYIDRGPDSKGAVKYVMKLKSKGYNVRCLMGNHEKMLLDSINSDKAHYQWMWNGGSECLRSFGVKKAENLKDKYLKFFQYLEYYIELDDFILVHGGFNFDIENPLEDKEAMLWERNDEVDISKIGGKRMIVGHTPVKLKKIEKSLSKDRILLDGGCVYAPVKNKLGYLPALELNSMELYTQYNIDM